MSPTDMEQIQHIKETLFFHPGASHCAASGLLKDEYFGTVLISKVQWHLLSYNSLSAAGDDVS